MEHCGHHFEKLKPECTFKGLKKVSLTQNVSLLPLATGRLDKKTRSGDEGKTVSLDGWLNLGQRNVVARGRVVGEILLRMKFPLVLIIPLKAWRLLFLPGRRANKPWTDRVCLRAQSRERWPS